MMGLHFANVKRRQHDESGLLQGLHVGLSNFCTRIALATCQMQMHPTSFECIGNNLRAEDISLPDAMPSGMLSYMRFDSRLPLARADCIICAGPF